MRGAGIASIGGCLMLGCLMQAACAGSPDDLHLAQVRWGFDGAIQRESFCLLQLLIENRSGQQWTGSVQLWRGGARFVDTVALIEVPVDLQPREQRWIEFTPYVIDEYDPWCVRWGPEKQHQSELPQPAVGLPATVLLVDDSALSLTTGVLRPFPESRFPLSESSLDGLRGLILDHDPQWVGAQNVAFKDWLQLGGRIVILQNARGDFPEFQSPLDFLNALQDDYPVGHGRVRRIARTAVDFSLDEARRELFADPNQPPRPAVRRNTPAWGNQNDAWSRNDVVLAVLKSLSRYRRPWLLIGCAALAYISVLALQWRRYARFDSDVKRYFIVFLSTAAAFSVLFLLLGQLGAQAQSRIRSAAVAIAIDNRVYQFTQWTTLASARAGDHSLTLPGAGVRAGTPSPFESIPGLVRQGRRTTIEYLMPPAAVQTLLHRAQVTLDSPPPLPEKLIVEGDRIVEFVAPLRGSCIRAPVTAALVSGNAIYRLNVDQRELRLPPRGASQTILEFFDSSDAQLAKLSLRRGWLRVLQVSNDERLENDAPEELFQPLLGNALGFTNRIQPSTRLGTSPIWLAVLQRAPPALQCQSESFPDQQGFVLLMIPYADPSR